MSTSLRPHSVASTQLLPEHAYCSFGKHRLYHAIGLRCPCFIPGMIIRQDGKGCAVCIDQYAVPQQLELQEDGSWLIV